MMKKGDLLLLLLLVFGIVLSTLTKIQPSVASWNGSSEQNRDLIAIIKKNNQIIKTINLSKLKKREVVDISGLYSAEIVAEYNRICIKESSCPDRICVKTGWLDSPGEMLVCMDNRVLIKIEQGTN